MSAMFPAFALLTAVAVAGRCCGRCSDASARVGRDRYELEVYRDQLAEMDRDRRARLIRLEEARAARLEIERRLLRVAGAMEATATAEPGPGRRGIVLAAALLVPTLAATFYAVLGSPRHARPPIGDAAGPQAESPERPDVQQMVARLEARLAQVAG